MFISKVHLSRRSVLRGLGSAVALPWLESMVPAFTALAKASAAPARRLGVFYVPNGMAMGWWFPRAAGPLAELPPTLRSINALKDQVLLVGGLNDGSANKASRGGDHARSAGTFLTCNPYQSITDANIVNATSMDQLAAKQFAKDTQLASLELAVESTAILGGCDGAGCALTNTIAWSSPTTPLPCENDPRSLFERLFGSSGSTDQQARKARIQLERSILDQMGSEQARLQAQLSPQDRSRVAEYLDSVRDVERRIQKAAEQMTRDLPVVEQPVGIPNDYAEHAALMMDLLALAYQTDLTRVCTFMLAREVSGRAYPEIGVSDSHHPLSHHQDEPAKLERLHKVNEYHFRNFGRLVSKLAEIPEGDGTMLDNSIFVYGTGISDSNTHFHDDLPIAVVGGRSAGIKGGRYIRQVQGTPLANLHLTLLDKLGVQFDQFGDSNGQLSNLSDAMVSI